jgi:hypothetical protein
MLAQTKLEVRAGSWHSTGVWSTAMRGFALSYRNSRSLRGWQVIALCAIAIGLSAPYCQAAVRMVAKVGMTAPGSQNRFGTFITSPPSVNIHGDVAFRAAYQSQGPEGIWAEDGVNGLQVVAINGQVAPGIPGGVFEYFGPSNPGSNAAVGRVVFTNEGKVPFRATLAGGSYFNSDGIWLGSTRGSPEFIARSGAPIAGSSQPVVQLQNECISMNDEGGIVFRGRYTQSYQTLGGLFRYQPQTGVQFVAQSLDVVPGLPSNRFSTVAFDGAAIDTSGNVYFTGGVGNATGGYTGTYGIYGFRAGTLAPIAVDGDTAPNDVMFDGIHSSAIAANSAGEVAFADFNGLWVASPTTGLDLRVERNAAAPGTASGVHFKDLYSPQLNRQGKLAFFGILEGPGVTSSNDYGIWSEDEHGELRLVAREGAPIPGDSSGRVFWSNFSSTPFAELVINAQGQIAFLGEFDAVSASYEGIFATDLNQELTSIVRSDTALQTTNDGIHWAGSLRFAGNTGNDEGLPSGFSDHGHVAFYSYSAQAIYVSDVVAVPEPSSFVLCVVLVAALLLPRYARGRGRVGHGK